MHRPCDSAFRLARAPARAYDQRGAGALPPRAGRWAWLGRAHRRWLPLFGILLCSFTPFNARFELDPALAKVFLNGLADDRANRRAPFGGGCPKCVRHFIGCVKRESWHVCHSLSFPIGFTHAYIVAPHDTRVKCLTVMCICAKMTLWLGIPRKAEAHVAS